jgi:hypothetical protein
VPFRMCLPPLGRPAPLQHRSDDPQPNAIPTPEATPSQPLPPCCCACGDYSRIQASMDILQELVFEVRHNLEDLVFRSELRERPKNIWRLCYLHSSTTLWFLRPQRQPGLWSPVTLGRLLTRTRLQHEDIILRFWF